MNYTFLRTASDSEVPPDWIINSMMELSIHVSQMSPQIDTVFKNVLILGDTGEDTWEIDLDRS
jgi:hypothetical protein